MGKDAQDIQNSKEACHNRINVRFITKTDLFGNKEEEDFEKKADSAFRKETFLDHLKHLKHQPWSVVW